MIRALSIRQPWAWAILHAGKRLENRNWYGCAYRGPVLLHAGKWPHAPAFRRDGSPTASALAFSDDARAMLDMARRSGAELPAAVTLNDLLAQRGGVVGRADIVGVVRSERDVPPSQAHWYAGGFALVLANVERVPFRPLGGALGLFNVPEEAMGASGG